VPSHDHETSATSLGQNERPGTGCREDRCGRVRRYARTGTGDSTREREALRSRWQIEQGDGDRSRENFEVRFLIVTFPEKLCC
jgi:hypothetical protein